jgi:hypothetical protein
MKIMLTLILIAVAALAAYIRLAPSDLARWHIALHPRPADIAAPSPQMAVLRGGAYIDLPVTDGLLARLDTIIMATPRTVRLAGSVDSGRMTWITRSALWGFPDYTTAEVGPQGLTIYSRLRFGGSDMGVNGARLAGWISALAKT